MIGRGKKISKNSSGIQADRDVTVNVGLTFDQVEKLTQLFLKENFPQLRDDAMKIAHENVDKFLKEFEKQLTQKFQEIDASKFSDPDVQSSINDAVLETAKRGDKSNLDLLTDLVFKRVRQDNNDLQSLAAGDAIKIISRLNTGQINYLSIMVLFDHMSLPNCTDIRQYDTTCKILLPILSHVDNLSGWNIQYLESKNCLAHLFIGRDDIYTQLRKKYLNLKPVEGQTLQQQIEQSIFLKLFTAQYEKHRMNFTRLTIIGQLIGAINIAKYSPKSVDFNNFIK
jgi:hypothetical protein